MSGAMDELKQYLNESIDYGFYDLFSLFEKYKFGFNIFIIKVPLKKGKLPINLFGVINQLNAERVKIVDYKELLVIKIENYRL